MNPRSNSLHKVARKRLRGFFGHFPQVKRIHQRLRVLIEGPRDGEEPECVAIIGDTGTGKSTLLGQLVGQYERTEYREFTEVPVLYCEVPARCTIKMLAGLLLRTLGAEYWNRGDEVERTYQLVTLIRACRVRLIILDEVNHLADRGAARTHYLVGDWIKQLIGAARVPVVLAGTPSAAILWQTNEQLADRYREVITLEPFSMASHRIAEFRSVLKSFGGLLIGMEVPSFKAAEMAQKMAFATAGRLRDIRRLLVRAVDIAEAGNSQRITEATLAEAFVQVIFPKAPAERNPFSAKFNGHPLIALGEPFAPRRL